MNSFFFNFFTVLWIVCASQAYANDMINNTAFGYVKGNIIQTATGHSTNNINVGSIAGSSINNTNVSASVLGDIAISTEDNQNITLSIGSVSGKLSK